MKLKQVIDLVDGIEPNDYSNDVKTAWLNECEGMVQTDVMLRAIDEIDVYNWTDDQQTTLLVRPPHDKIYRFYLQAMIQLANAEYDRYQNTMTVFNEAWGEFVRWFSRVIYPAGHEAIWRGYYITAYGIAVQHGYHGTAEEWLESLKGEAGKDAYDGAVEAGYEGTEEDFYRILANVDTYARQAQEAAQAAGSSAQSAESSKNAASGSASEAAGSATSAAASAAQAAATLGTAVQYTAQTGKTDTQKQQARDNIAAAGRTEVEPLINQWDEQLEGGSYNTSTGAKETATQICRSKNKIKVNGNTAYYFNLTGYNNYNAFFWNSNNQFISASAAKTSNGVITTPENAAYMAFHVWKNGSSWGTTPPTVSWSINYPATYTGYYPANYSGVKNSLGKLGSAIARSGWNQLATPNCINKSMTASGPDTEYLFSFDAVNGHKYYFVIDLSRAATQSGNHDFQFYWQGAWTSYHIDGAVKHRSMIVTASASGTQRVIFGTYNDYQGNLTLNYINLIDLTEIFGAGNEPTIEQLKQLFPDDYYPYATPGFGDLLWENAAPASAFASQLVAVDLSQYKWVLVRCFISTTDTYYITPMILSTADNKDAFIATHFTGTNVRRQVGVRPTGVNFGTCYDGSNNNNATIIPYQIYGIR